MSINGESGTGRYAGIAIAQTTVPSGRPLLYYRRRFVPDPSTIPAWSYQTVGEDARLDLLAHTLLGDPERFWMLCDAAGVVRPEDLVSDPMRSIPVPAPGAGFGGVNA